MRPPEGQMPGTPSPDPISTRRRRIALRVRGLTAAQRIHGTRSRVPELGTPGSVGGRGGKPPRPTRRAPGKLGKGGSDVTRKPFDGTLRGTNPRPAELGQQPEVSLAWGGGNPHCEA